MTQPDITVSDLEIMSAATNYRGWMYRRIEPYLGRRILEVGAGIGNFTSLLLDRDLVVALDQTPSCIETLRARLGDPPRLVTMTGDVADPSLRTLRAHRFDTVICLNVLEHVDDDQAALGNLHAVLDPGGRLVLLVPALRFLYGSVDRALRHHRRYTRRELLEKLRAAGFEVERAFYMNLIGILGWLWNNRLRRREEESPAQIGFFDRFVAPPAEAIERILPPPIGLSLIAIGHKSS